MQEFCTWISSYKQRDLETRLKNFQVDFTLFESIYIQGYIRNFFFSVELWTNRKIKRISILKIIFFVNYGMEKYVIRSYNFSFRILLCVFFTVILDNIFQHSKKINSIVCTFDFQMMRTAQNMFYIYEENFLTNAAFRACCFFKNTTGSITNSTIFQQYKYVCTCMCIVPCLKRLPDTKNTFIIIYVR